MTTPGLIEAAHRTIRYNLGLDPGRNGGCYANHKDVPALLRIYANELTDEERANYKAILREIETGQMRLGL